MTWLLLLAGCGMGPNEETLLDELRIIGAVVEPPEVGPGEGVSVQPTVVDPAGEGFELVVWACTPTGVGCVEDELALGSRLAVPRDGEAVTLTVPDLPLPEGVVAPGVLWLLACAPDVCPVIGRARAALDGGGVLPGELADPYALLQGLPLQGVSLATRNVGVSNRDPSLRNLNPVVTLTAPLPETLDAEARLQLPLDIHDDSVAGALVAAGLTTGGGFAMPLFDVLDGRADLVFYAPAESGDVDLYVVIEDGLGGSAVWVGQTRVR